MEYAGTEMRAFGKDDAPMVQAAKFYAVKDEFFARYVADSGDEKQQRDAQSKAFRRALEAVQKRGEYCSGNVQGEGWIWPVKP